MECISEPLLKGCLEGYIEPTRTRACHKDDTGYMEQKNFDAVRKTVGSFRFDTPRRVRCPRGGVPIPVPLWASVLQGTVERQKADGRYKKVYEKEPKPPC
jgi:hypothetical protein